MNPSETGAGSGAEVGAWKAYDASGALVGEGLLDPRGQAAQGSFTYDFRIDTAADFTSLEVSARAYGNGAAGGSGDSSDFALAQVTYVPGDGAPPPTPSAALLVTSTNGTNVVTEGGSGDSLSLALASRPAADVVVTVVGGADLGVAAGNGAPGASTTVTFTPQNWSTSQMVFVSAVNDTTVEGAETGRVTFATASADPAYANLSTSAASVSIIDNDTATPGPGGGGLGGGTPPSDAVVLRPGDNIQAAIDSNPAGTAFLLSEGTYRGLTLSPKSGNSFYGENGKAVLDGDGAAHAFRGQGASDVTVSGLVITDYAPPASGIGVFGTDSGSRDWVIEGCEITDIGAGPAIMLGTGMVVRDNWIHHNQAAGIGSWNITGAVIEGNEISFNNQSGDSPFSPTGAGAGIKIAQSTNVRIADNDLHDNVTAPGVWTDINCDGTVIENNRIVDNGGPGVLVELDYGAVVRNNLIEGNNDPSLQGFQGGGIYVQNSRDTEVYGNTIRDNVGGVWVYEGERGSGTQGPWVIENVTIRDNTIQMASGDNGEGGSAQGDPSVRWSGNDYVLTGSAELIGPGGSLSAAAWQASGNDTASSGATFSGDAIF
jgi:parallel beta-helix repeat protein